MNQVVMMEQLIEALKKQAADLEAEKSIMKRERYSADLINRYTITLLERQNKVLWEIVSSMDKTFTAAKADLQKIGSLRVYEI